MLLPISINMVVQKQNHHELFSIYDFAIKNNFNFYPILLTHPDTYSLLKLAPSEKNTIINNYLKKNLEVKSIEIFMFIKKFYYQIQTNEIASENKLLYFENLNIFKNKINHEE
jgi:MoaA/NifB/PqqE/SkfB family radical SAM enzyme